MANDTRKTILKTFAEMLYDMPFDKISVSALVAKCEISSNTFYYHFRDLYDLLDTWLGQWFASDPVDAVQDDAWKQTLRLLQHEIRDHRRQVDHLSHSIARDRLERYVFGKVEDDAYRVIRTRLGDRPMPEDTARLLAGMCGYTLCGFLLQYIWNGYRADPDKTCDQLAALLDQCVRACVRELGA